MSPVPRAVASRAVFSIDAEMFTWADVVRAAEARGDWQAFLTSVRDGVAAEAHAIASSGEPSAAELDAAMMKFRYELDLIAGDDLLEWLSNVGLTTAEWQASLSRAISRERFADALGEPRDADCAGDHDVEAAAWPDAVCSGFIVRAARQLAADVALAAGSGLVASGRSVAEFQRIQAAAEAARASAVTPGALERAVADNRVEWMGVRGLLLELDDEDIAREAAMCVRTDGAALADVARDCGAEAMEVHSLLADIEEALSAQVLAAREGDLIGPVALGETWLLVTIKQKTPPTLDDPLVRQRASERVVRSAEERAISRSVTWHESL